MISYLAKFIDFICPRACAICGCRLSLEEDLICLKCNLHLDRTYYSKDPYNNEMAKLFWVLLPIERCAAWFFYHSGDTQSRLIYDLKYFNRSDIGIKMGNFAAKEMIGDDFFEGIDVIVPVPLAKNRRRQRGYNQSEMIAQGVSEATGIVVDNHVVQRKKYTRSQTRLTPIERQENVKDIFLLIAPERLKGRHVLIIDDV